MKNFWELFAESVIVQSLLALILVVAIVVMIMQGREVPEQLWTLLGLILGFYFGGKTQLQAAKISALKKGE